MPAPADQSPLEFMESPSFVSTLRGKIAVALGLTLLAVALQWLMFPLIGKRAPFLMFLPAIMLTAMLAGTRLSLLVMAAGAVNGIVLLAESTAVNQPSSTTHVVVLIYVLAGLMVAALGSRLHGAILRTREAEQRLEVALQDTGVALFDIDLQAETIFASGSLRSLLGHPPMEGGSNRLMTLAEWGAGIALEEMEGWRSLVKQCESRGVRHHESTHSVIGSDGAISWLLIKTHFEFDASQIVVRLRGAVMDISTHKCLDLQLERARSELGQQVGDWQMLHTLSNQLLRPGAADAQARAILETVTAFHGTAQGLIAVFDPATGEQSITCCSGFSAAAMEQLMARPTASDAGASGLAYLERRQVIIEDTEADQRYARFRTFSRAHNIRAVYSTPFFGSDGDIIGVVTVHFPTPRRPAPRELRFSAIYAGSVALFFERQRMESALHDERDRNRRMLQSLRQASLGADDESQHTPL